MWAPKTEFILVLLFMYSFIIVLLIITIVSLLLPTPVEPLAISMTDMLMLAQTSVTAKLKLCQWSSTCWVSSSKTCQWVTMLIWFIYLFETQFSIRIIISVWPETTSYLSNYGKRKWFLNSEWQWLQLRVYREKSQNETWREASLPPPHPFILPFPVLLPQVTIGLLSVITDTFVFPSVSSKWNHPVCNFFSLVSLTQHNL